MKIKFIIKSKNKRFPVKVDCNSYEDGISMLKSEYGNFYVVKSEIMTNVPKFELIKQE